MSTFYKNQPAFFSLTGCDLSDFETLIAHELSIDMLTHADDVQKNIPIYDMARLRPLLDDPQARQGLMAEWAWIYGQSAGVVVLKNAYPDTTAIDLATEIYLQIIEEEKESSTGADHFAGKGKNDRIWNSLQKLCERDPATYISYFSNTSLNAACEAWLGPNYQMTAQVNLVYPGGEAQQPHRDYHFGFQTADVTARYPAHVHDISTFMTLQGGVAHVDMPIESGPTKLLPFSQLYRPGYMAYRREDFAACFEANYVQMPVEKGDAFFFNPALFHAAGSNTSTDINRFANLMQISSVMGIPLENVDRAKMCRLIYPGVARAAAAGTLNGLELEALITSTAYGYSFSTNLDTDPPSGGLAPETQAALFLRALNEDMPEEAFSSALEEQLERRKA